MPGRPRFGLGLVAVLAGVAAAAASAKAAEPTTADLTRIVEDLQQEVSLLRRKLEVQEDAQAARGPQPLVGAAKDGFYLRSPDRAFDIRFRGYTHFDTRWFTEEDDDSTDTFIFRRVRPYVEGTLGNVADFRIMPDFANSSLVLQDAWLNLRHFPLANVQGGKFKAPFGLERLQSATSMLFVERALPTQLVPNRDLGMMVHGIWGEGLLQYQLAWMNGVTDGSSAESDVADGKDVVARVFAHPFQNQTEEWLSGLGLGFAAGYGRQENAGTPSVYRTQGQATFFNYRTGANGVQLDGNRVRYSPQLYYYWGPFGALAEFVRSSTDVTRLGRDEQFDHEAWQIAASYVLTGESASYKGVIPRSDFGREEGDGWGAWEVAARFHQLEVDDGVFRDGGFFADPTVAAAQAKAWGVGVNWHLNRWVKLMLNYDRSSFDGGGGGSLTDPEDRDAESVVFLRWQLNY
jgi:phosphate-selective porin OprO/OprP